jgi:hypothetical protein
MIGLKIIAEYIVDYSLIGRGVPAERLNLE